MNFMMTRIKIPSKILLIILVTLLVSCNESGKTNQKPTPSGSAATLKKSKELDTDMKVPIFNPDSAFAFIESQLAFGPRVPNTQGHVQCGQWIQNKLETFGADVIIQEARLRAYDGTILNAKNIIGQFQPEKANRILLMAHWDTRHVADHDPLPENHNSPIPGANDGASGVAVLLEIARHLSQSPTTIGIDIVLFDAEDYGVPENSDFEWEADTWCLGSQYWSRNPHVKDYYARYGILLDMVGGKNAIFTQEEISVYYAPSILEKVWKTARELGYSSYFSYEKTPQLVDDHRYVNEIIGIPSIDIIQYDHSTDSHFGSYWHTLSDNIDSIDKETLKAVGEVVMNVIFKEK